MKRLLIMLLAFFIIGMSGCDGDNGDSNGIFANQVLNDPVTNPYKICAGSVPAGVGIDLDSNTAYDLGANPDFAWDIRIKVFKADYVDSPDGTNTGDVKGAPHIKLHGISVKAYEHTEGTGETEYESITSASVVSGNLIADDVEELVLDEVLKDPDGYPYFKGGSGLNKYYDDNLVIGNDWKLSPDWTIGNEPVYIIETDAGKHVKFMIKGMGPGGSNPGQKFIDVTFDLLN